MRRVGQPFRVGYLLRVSLISSALLASSLSDPAEAQQPQPDPRVLAYADLVIHNGRVLTMDARGTVVEAIAVRGNSILAVGDNRDVLALAGPHTRVIDAAGRSVIPGLVDTHTHLHEYAMGHWAPTMAPHLAPIRIQGSSPDEMIANLGIVLERIPAGEWVLANIRPREVADELVLTKTRLDLDQASSEHLVLLRITDTKNMANSRAITALLERYPEEQLELKRDANGTITGETGSGVSLIFDEELMPKQRPEVVAPIFARELQEYGSAGITTWSSSLGSEAITAFNWLDRRGEMPIRLGYTHEPSIRDNPAGEGFAARLGVLTGNGTPFVWLIGLSPGSTDSSYPGVCTTIDARPEIKAREDCRLVRGGTRWRSGYEAVKQGHRISGTHSAGDAMTDALMNMIEEASLEAGMTYDEIRAQRHAIDHCTMNPRPDQIDRGLLLGITWSCGPKYHERASRYGRDYGSEIIHERTLPVGGILRAGGKVVWETDDHEHGLEPFRSLQILVTRRDPEGEVWGATHAVDRMTALRMATIWGAEYVLREDRIGSLEPGKWADIVLLSGDYQAVPDDEIGRLRAVMTIVNGRIIFEG